MGKKQDKGLSRNTIDKFYTQKNIVNLCIDTLKESLININKDDLIIEPSAGNGAFITKIKTLCDNYTFYDIQPEHNDIIKKDYLNYKHTESKQLVHVIGNPPFGRQSSMAIKFIKKSAEYADSISFILPKSFKKDSMKKFFPLNYHLLKEIDLPNNSFIIEDVEHDVPCIFQIWQRKNINRPPIKKLTPLKFSFIKNNENPDISFRRVGVNAGVIDKSSENKSIQSHYFIKFDDDVTDDLIKKISNINFDCKNNTVGPKSISKQELIKCFNPIFE